MERRERRNAVTVLAPAKLNLALDVVGLLPGGYHDLDMTMQAITLYERVMLRRSAGLSLRLPGSLVQPNDKNTAIKAALAFFHYTGLLAGVDITIYKNTPVRAGMAGGSADAAAVLGTLRDIRATDALTVLLEDDVVRVRANACAALAATDDEAGEQLLLERLSQAGENTLVKVSALDALARRCERNESVGERVLSALLVCSTDSDLDVSSTAVWALGFACGAQSASRDQVQAVLEGALAGEAEWGARYAVESLTRIHDDKAHATLAAFDASTSALPDILTPLVTQALATFE